MKSMAFITLGCDKNLVDSEVALGKLLSSGYNTITTPEEADLVIVNTCAFIPSACEESESWIEKIIRLKRSDPKKTLAILGCYVQRFGKNLPNKYPEIDFWIGVNDFPKIADIISHHRDQKVYIDQAPFLYNEQTERILSTPSHYAYIKIAEGCNHRCSYCLIPTIRGKQRSRSIESIQKEVINLVNLGVKEIILVAQDVGSYGVDLTGKRMLANLLRTFDQLVPNRVWIRLLYVSPDSINDELIEVLASSTKICKYLDVPLQHVDSTILKAMNRPSDIESILKKLSHLRQSVPGIFLRTTFMVGFPGETESAFHSLLSAVKSFRFERLGCFTYSEQPETPASQLSSPVEDSIKMERYHRLMKIQEDIVSDFHRSLVGKTLEFILDDGPFSNKKPYFYGRTYGDAPDVDGRIKLTLRDKTISCHPGDILNGMVTKSDRYDLEGVYP